MLSLCAAKIDTIGPDSIAAVDDYGKALAYFVVFDGSYGLLLTA